MISCDCVLPDALISFPFGNTAAMRANYKGRGVELRTVSGAVVRLTEGHMLPVAPAESKRAGCIVAGDQLYRLSPSVLGYQEAAEGLFGTVTEEDNFLHVRAMVKPHYFHSEGARMSGSVHMSILDPRQKFVNLENTLARKPVGNANLVRHIPVDAVESVTAFDYEGQVFDFSGDSLAFYAVDGVIVHNCRASLDLRLLRK